ncbi:hypothetical protein LIA77_05580 [Sarocladium implicatum]|nr:hypothetical protein LIA77_05580 [Sarocladium implicatum]
MTSCNRDSTRKRGAEGGDHSTKIVFVPGMAPTGGAELPRFQGSQSCLVVACGTEQTLVRAGMKSWNWEGKVFNAWPRLNDGPFRIASKGYVASRGTAAGFAFFRKERSLVPITKQEQQHIHRSIDAALGTPFRLTLDTAMKASLIQLFTFTFEAYLQ